MSGLHVSFCMRALSCSQRIHLQTHQCVQLCFQRTCSSKYRTFSLRFVKGKATNLKLEQLQNQPSALSFYYKETVMIITINKKYTIEQSNKLLTNTWDILQIPYLLY